METGRRPHSQNSQLLQSSKVISGDTGDVVSIQFPVKKRRETLEETKSAKGV